MQTKNLLSKPACKKVGLGGCLAWSCVDITDLFCNINSFVATIFIKLSYFKVR